MILPMRSPHSSCWVWIAEHPRKLHCYHLTSSKLPKYLTIEKKSFCPCLQPRKPAAESIRAAQSRYKDRLSREADYQLGDWVLVHFPQDETSRQHKLLLPWHGPYRVVDRRDPDVTVVKVYAPQDGQIQVHQTRVAHCPPELPSGFFWYGNRRAGPGRPR